MKMFRGNLRKILVSVKLQISNFLLEYFATYTLTMKLQSMRLATPLLGVLMWVISIHSGTFSNASIMLPSALPGLMDESSKGVHSSQQSPGMRNVIRAYEHVTLKDLNDTIDFIAFTIGLMATLERNIDARRITVYEGTPSHGMLISFGPEKEAVEMAQDGYLALRATEQLKYTFCPNWEMDRECVETLKRFTFRGTTLGHVCDRMDTPCSEEEFSSPYRTSNGSCNNIEWPHQGESFTGYGRILGPNYIDSTHQIRRSVTKSPLPNVRKIVKKLVKHESRPSEKFTLALMLWSEFIEHDLSKTATAVAIHTKIPIECCFDDCSWLAPRDTHPFCEPIHVNDDDSYSKIGVSCLNFVRSILAVRPDCRFGPAEQLNQATHFLDGSQIYGNTNRKSNSVRSFTNGELRTSTYKGRSFLPLSKDPTKDCQIFSNTSFCYESGDTRVNFQPQLALLHTLWYREHNRIAKELAMLNSHWNDERLFQETRRIVTAELQKITYTEWLSAVLGDNDQHSILTEGGYSDKIDASVANSFATAVMRAMKSLADGKPKLYREDRKVNETIFLRNYFHNPTLLRHDGVLDALARGLATQSSQKLDVYYAEDLINQLYSNGRFGFDILSFDIERGRDHGLANYADFRSFCGLNAIESFSDFSDSMSQESIQLLSKAYENPKDVDLIIGGLLENPRTNSVFGPTFSCIFTDQLKRTRRGDRYFYTNRNQPKPFTWNQLSQLENVSLARIICDNADDVRNMQPKVFEQISQRNSLVNCQNYEAIPRLDLNLWLDNPNNL